MPALLSDKKPANIINHVVEVVDMSGSMGIHRGNVVRVVDGQNAQLAELSRQLNQETRVSVYVFSDDVECLIYDKDVLRLPSIADDYVPDGMTALVKAVLLAIEELKQTAQLHGEHSFLIYVITDGKNNLFTDLVMQLITVIKELPDNWTLAVFVPNAANLFDVKKWGFPAGNCVVWDTTSAAGIREVGSRMTEASASFMKMRAAGVRGTKTLFRTEDVKAEDIVKTMTPVTRGSYFFTDVMTADTKIEDLAPIVTGKPFDPNAQRILYPHVKSELIQEYKKIAILAGHDFDKDDLYMGEAARQRLKLPLTGDVRVSPSKHTDCIVYVGSTAPNRLIREGQRALIFR